MLGNHFLFKLTSKQDFIGHHSKAMIKGASSCSHEQAYPHIRMLRESDREIMKILLSKHGMEAWWQELDTQDLKDLRENGLPGFLSFHRGHLPNKFAVYRS